MANNIVLTINNVTVGSANFDYGKINVVYKYGSSNVTMSLSLTTKSASTGKFQWKGVPDNGISKSAQNYALAFNRDFKNVGGNNNLNATYSSNKITITCGIGEFISASEDSDVMSMSHVVNNTVVVIPPIQFSTSLNGSGNCSTVGVICIASGGISPYTLRNGTTVLKSNWSGSSETVQISRSISVHSLNVVDDDGDTIQRSIIAPRSLVASSFSVNQIQQIGSADLEINNNNVISGTTPIQYSLDGIDYSVDTNMSGILEGDYTLYIKDKYNCVIEKTIVVESSVDPTVEYTYDHLKISNFNSISYSPLTTFGNYTKKNYENTLSYNDFVKVGYTVPHKFTVDDIQDGGVGTQFQSSYPYHNITLYNCDGSNVSLASIMIQENLGTSERVDCELIPVTGGIGVYFDGGNEYEPSTTTVINASEHIQYLPDWANEGQFVFIVSLGYKEIIGFGYDANLDKEYFIVSGVLGSASSGIVEVKYDIHNYNLFEYYLDPSYLTGTGYIVLEAGYSFDKISKTQISEPIELVNDSDNLLLIEWEGYKNMGDMTFVSGIKGLMRIEGKIRPYAKGEAELSETDSGSYPLYQKSTMGQSVYIPMTTPKLWDKINDISGISIGGTLKINGLELVRNSPIEVEEKGDTNLSDVTMTFDYGNNSLTIQQDEIVLNVSTGNVGGGSSIDDDYDFNLTPIVFDNKTRLVNDSGLFIIGDSGFISV